MFRASEVRDQRSEPCQVAEDGRTDEAAVAGYVDGSGFGDGGWHGVISGLRTKRLRHFWHGLRGWTRLLPIVSPEIRYLISGGLPSAGGGIKGKNKEERLFGTGPVGPDTRIFTVKVRSVGFVGFVELLGCLGLTSQRTGCYRPLSA